MTVTDMKTEPKTDAAVPLDPPVAVTVTREIAATPERLWTLWLDPDARMRWFGMDGITNTACVSEPVVGGAWRMDATGPNGAFFISGHYVALEPHRRLVMSWAHTGDNGVRGNETEAEILFEPIADGTRVTVNHRQIRYTPDMFALGWTQSLGKIADMA